MLARKAMMARVLPKLQAVLDPFMMHTFITIVSVTTTETRIVILPDRIFG